MDPAELLIRQPPSVGVLRDIHIAADQPGVAPAALAAAAVRGGLDPGALHGPEQRLLRLAGDGLLLAPDIHGEGKFFALLAGGEIGVFGSAQIVAGHLHAVAALGQAQLLHLALFEAVHGLGAAHEHGVIALGRVLPDQLRRDEAVLKALLLLVGQDMHHLDPAL